MFDLQIISSPTQQEKIVFACDESYFLKYGIYNILSCNKVGHHVHVHIINPTEETFSHINRLKDIVTIDLSVSINHTSLTDWPLRSFYFFCRFLVTNWLLKNTDITTAYVVDADVVFRKSLNLETNSDIGVIYHPEKDQPWRKVNGNFYFFKKNSVPFLDRVIARFENKLENYGTVHNDLTKDELGNITALDQVCIGEELDNYIPNGFVNLVTLPYVVSKHEGDTCSIWSFTGGGQKSNPELQEKLKTMFGYSK